MAPLDPKNASVLKKISDHELDAGHLDIKWNYIKDQLHKEFGDMAYRSWIAPLTAVSFENKILQIAVPTRFIRDWVAMHYRQAIQGLWGQSYGPIQDIDFVLGSARPKLHVIDSPSDSPDSSGNNTAPANQNANRRRSEQNRNNLSSPLDARYTFDDFIIGPSNQLAYAAAERIAGQGETVSFNPLYIKGSVGLGKTHLLHAIGWALKERAPQKNVVYMSAEKFMYQFVLALKSRDTVSFKDKFRSIDVLMIDDIQFIAGKGSTQEEFIHTFNALVDNGKQVVVTADRTPAELDGLEERLRSRLGWGLVAEIQAPSVELRRSILNAKRQKLNVAVPDEVIDFLAARITSNVRELEGALNRIAAHSDLMGRAVTLQGAEEMLHDVIRAHARKISMDDIQRAVAEFYDLQMSDMISARRLRRVARPRQVAMYLCKQLTERSLPEIGRKFGGRDHTTVIHAVKKIEELITGNPALCEDVYSLKRRLENA